MPKKNGDLTPNNNWLTWSAIIISITSLLVSFMAFAEIEKVGQSFNSFATMQLSEAEEQTQASLARAEARVKLEALQAQVVANESIENVEQQIEEIRMNMRTIYADGTAESNQQLAEIEADLDQLERELREDGASSLERVSNLITRLENEVQP